MKTPAALRKTLIVCGIVSSVLYVVADIIASRQWEAYSFTGQAFSELTAIEAPTRPFMVVLTGVSYNLLVVAFSAGIWIVAAGFLRPRPMRIMSVMLCLHALSGFVGGTLFPMHSRGMENTATVTDTIHIISTAVEVCAMLLAIGFGAIALGKWFRVYSIGTLILLFACGGLAAMYGPAVAQNRPTPGLGIVERVNIYGFMLWTIVAAVVLLRRNRSLSPAVKNGS